MTDHRDAITGDYPPARWRVVRRVGWSLVIHPDRIHVFASASHAAAIAYADRLAREEAR